MAGTRAWTLWTSGFRSSSRTTRSGTRTPSTTSSGSESSIHHPAAAAHHHPAPAAPCCRPGPGHFGQYCAVQYSRGLRHRRRQCPAAWPHTRVFPSPPTCRTPHLPPPRCCLNLFRCFARAPHGGPHPANPPTTQPINQPTNQPQGHQDPGAPQQEPLPGLPRLPHDGHPACVALLLRAHHVGFWVWAPMWLQRNASEARARACACAWQP